MSEIRIYTDGASRGNPGPGGYGVILMAGHNRKELSGGYRHTTNNRMELMAVIEGLKALKRHDIAVTIYSDSQYITNAMNKGWLKTWIRTQFKGGKKNRDLWEMIHHFSNKIPLTFIWVKGHADNEHNNRCDELATEAADGDDLLIDEIYERENPFKIV